MKAEVRETGPLQREVEVRLEAEEVHHFIDSMVDAYRGRYAFPGFRRGKAPDNVVRRRFHDEIEHAVMTDLVPRTVAEALAEKKVRPAGPGRISRTSYEPGQPLTVQVQLEVWPEFELKPYAGMQIDQLIEEVAPADVERHLTWLRERFADTPEVDREARPGDLLEAEMETVDVSGQRMAGTDVEAVQVEVGSAEMLAPFVEASLGIRVGETRELKVDYPGDFPDEGLRGQTRRYRMKALKIREKKIPPLDDEFARRLEPDLDLAGLQARVRLRLESEKRMAARQRLEQQLTDRLIRETPFDLPETSVAMALDSLAKKQSEAGQKVDRAELERIYRPHIERAHRRELILARVAECEGIQVGQAEVDAEIERIAQEEKRSVADVRKQIDDRDGLRNFLFERKVFAALLEKVEVNEVMVPAAAQPDAPAVATDSPAEPTARGEKESTDE